MTSRREHLITLDDISSRIKNQSFAVIGPMVFRAYQIEEELKKGVKKPFTEIIKTNVGNPQAMDQAPITFIRQVLALVSYPKLLEDPSFPEDAKQRAKIILESCGGSVGCYSRNQGIHVLRKQVAKYIEERDGIPANYEDIIIANGAGDCIGMVLRLFNGRKIDKKWGLLIPYPQYPLYGVFATEYDMHEIPYFLNEENNWDLDMTDLQRAVDEARKVCDPKVLIITNPGNPTGQVLPRKSIEEVIRFAYKEKLFLFADEVYQTNIWDESSQFHSFKKVAADLGVPYSQMEIASFMSVSKGFMGECGLRSGYCELINLSPEVQKIYNGSMTFTLCPNNCGQASLYAALDPPQCGEPSHELFIKEKNELLDKLKVKAKFIEKMLNSLEGYHCTPVQGAYYAFPRITLPPKAIEDAKKKNMPADTMYCSELLENTGICVVPGNGFGQKPDTYHFRTTIMPSLEQLRVMGEKITKFHAEFMDKYK